MAKTLELYLATVNVLNQSNPIEDEKPFRYSYIQMTFIECPGGLVTTLGYKSPSNNALLKERKERGPGGRGGGGDKRMLILAKGVKTCQRQLGAALFAMEGAIDGLSVCLFVDSPCQNQFLN